MSSLALDSFGRYYPTCSLDNGQERNFQVNPCPSAFAWCNGSCNRFRVRLEDGTLVGGQEADLLVERYWAEKKLHTA